MNKPVAIKSLTVDFDAEFYARVEQVAAANEISVDTFVRTAVAVALEEEAGLDVAFPRMDDAAFDTFIQEGIDDIEAGRFCTQEQMEIWFAGHIADARERAGKIPAA